MGYTTQLMGMIAETQYELERMRTYIQVAEPQAVLRELGNAAELVDAVAELRRRLRQVEYEEGSVGRWGRA